MTQKISIQQSGAQGPPLNPRGMALVLCLLLITSLSLIGGAALGISALNHKIVHNGAKQTQAFYMAEAGRLLALACLGDDPMWRGGGEPPSGIFEGGIAVGGSEGVFSVALWDRTADENGIYSALLPAGHVLLESTGTWSDAVQTVSCMARISPKEGTQAAFPPAAVISAGSAAGPLVCLDDLGAENMLLLQAPLALPEANRPALKALAETVFSTLDDDAWDAALNGVGSFWQDAPACTRPRILYVQGDLALSGNRQLHGIVFVEGEDVSLAESSGVRGVLYAPDATDVTVDNTGASGRIVVFGQLVTGPGGVTVSGNPAAFRHDPEYVNAFNVAAGFAVDVQAVAGSWTMR